MKYLTLIASLWNKSAKINGREYSVVFWEQNNNVFSGIFQTLYFL